MKDVVIGIDIGGTFTKYGLVDNKGNCLVEGSISTDKHESFEPYLKELYFTLEKLIEGKRETHQLRGIGIGAPNGNYYTGSIEYAPNLKWKGIVNVVEEFKKYYEVPVVLTNDANAAALGEMLYGGAKGMSNFIVITLGTGLGSGIVVNGEVVYGHDGFAGELGHINVKIRGRECGCGRRGCLETYVSATGIKRTIFRLLAERIVDSELRGISYENLTAKMVTNAALERDPIAIEAFEYTGKILGAKLADTMAHTSPEAFFLFGGLANAGDLLFDPTRRALEDNLLPIYKGKVKVLPSGLQDTNVAVLGSSALIWNELKKLQEVI
ncbi:MAG: ROK family protein [bacterium]